MLLRVIVMAGCRCAGVVEAIEWLGIFHDSRIPCSLIAALVTLAMTNRDATLALNMTMENFVCAIFVIASVNEAINRL